MNTLADHLAFPFKECFQKVDYSKWERSRRQSASLPPVREAAVPRKTDAGQCGGSVCHQNKTRPGLLSLKAPEGSAVGSAVQVSGRKENVVQRAISRRNKNTEILKLFIQSRKKAIKELEKHCAYLLELNRQLVEEIINKENHSFTCAQDCLSQYEKLGRSITALKGWSQRETRKAKEELEDAEQDAKKSICDLQNRLAEVEVELVKARAELYSLRTYTDKEYHINALRIAKLKREIEQVKEIQKLSSITHSLSQIFSQNDKMRREIDVHKKVIKELEDGNREVAEEIEKLQVSKPSVREDIFPQVLPRTHKCNPDTDVTLDIPREECPPI